MAKLCREQRENGVVIPEGAEYRLTVDPYDFYIHTESIKDEALPEAMERAINSRDNGKLLYNHIESCNPTELEVPEALGLSVDFDRPDYTQYKNADSWKMSICHTVLHLIRLDIRTLDRANGTFFTPEGLDLWLFLQKLDMDDRHGLKDAYLTYRQHTENGWDSTARKFNIRIFWDGRRSGLKNTLLSGTRR